MDDWSTDRVGDLGVAGALPPVVAERHVLGVVVLQQLREVVGQLRQRVVVRPEHPGTQDGKFLPQSFPQTKPNLKSV